jgi:hypothetical protein
VIKLESKQKGIQTHLDGMIARSKGLQGFLQRNVLDAYRNAQRKRWDTQNASEIGLPVWPSLNERYAKMKLVKYRNFEGQGRKMMIATNNLSSR